MPRNSDSTSRDVDRQDASAHLTPARRNQAAKTQAILTLQRSARRCARHLGREAANSLLELVARELGVTIGGDR